MNEKEKILVVGAEENERKTIISTLRNAGYSLTLSTPDALPKNQIGKRFKLILADLDNLVNEILNLLLITAEKNSSVEIIFMVSMESLQKAFNLVKSGASDYILKPINPDDLTLRVSKALEKRALKMENILYKERLEILLAETIKELQDQKGFFQSLCYNIPIGLAYITSDMRIIETNPLWTKYASNYPMLVGGQKWKALNVILNTNPALVAEELFRNMKPELAIVSAPDGKFFKFQWVPLFGITSIPGFLEIIDDITDEIKTKAQWETTLNSVDEGVILLDMDLNINWTNNLIRRWFNPNQIIPKELYFCSNEMEKENVRANVIRGGKTIRKCVRVEQQNGEMIFQSVISPVRDEYGNVLQLVVIVEDITERENMLDQLRRQAETLNRLHRKSLERIKTLRFTLKLSDALLINDELESIYHILLTIATANEGFGFNRAFLFLYNSKKKTVHGTCGVGQLYPEEVSKVWQELKGITLDDLIKNTSTTMNSKLTELIRKYEFPLNDFPIFERVFNCGMPVKIAFEEIPEVLRKELGLSDVYLLPLVGKSGPIGLIIGDNFVTHAELEHRKLQILKIFLNEASIAVERAIFANNLKLKYKELEELNYVLKESKDKLVIAEKLSTIGEMTAKIAHEIRNPLTVVGGFASVLLKNMDKNDPSYKHAKTIADETKKVIDMVNNLLDFSRFLKIAPAINDFNKVIHNTIILFKEEFEKNNIELAEKYEKSIPLFMFDGGAFRQVIMNLIKNAIEAMPNGGTINVKTYKGEDFVYLSVSDTGSGIPEETGTKIFEPFFTTRATGIGLGLTISKQIIIAMKGDIWFKTLKPKGTSFFVKIPILIYKGGEDANNIGG